MPMSLFVDSAYATVKDFVIYLFIGEILYFKKEKITRFEEFMSFIGK